METEYKSPSMSRRQLLAAYMKARKKALCLGVICIVIFLVIMLLFYYPVDGIIYASILCACAAVIFSISDFNSFIQRHRCLERIRQTDHLETDMFPAPKDLIETDYIRLCKKLTARCDELASASEAAQEEMIDYYTMWVHQIKTPIFAMRLLLTDTPSQKDQAIAGELFKIEQYADMVLSYLRLDSHYNDLVIRRQPLDDILKQAVRKYAPLFIRKKISLDYQPTGAVILTDEKWFLFIIEQLLSNALKYTPTGKISIYLDNPHTLVIEDTGIGIEPEDLPRIFEKGFTGYNGRTDKKASGLGLWLCRRAADMLSHTIRIESEPDRGTRVYISFSSERLRLD